MQGAVIKKSAESGKADVVRVPLARMGLGDTFIRRQGAAFRSAVERKLVEAGTTIGIAQASRIHTATIALRRHLQAEKRLANEGAGLSIADWTALADRTLRYKEIVDRSLSALGLEAKTDPNSWIDEFYKQPVPPAPDEPEATTPAAAATPASAEGTENETSRPDDSDAATGTPDAANGNHEQEAE
jgi:hypothetical protein